MQNRFGLLDTDVMPVFMINALGIVITSRFSINCSAVICSPTVIISISREDSSETCGPWVYFTSYQFPVNFPISIAIPLFCNLYFPFHKPKILKILLYRLSISIRSHLANNHDGIDNPFPFNCYCTIVTHTYILSILLCLEQILFELCLYLDLATKTRMIQTIK